MMLSLIPTFGTTASAATTNITKSEFFQYVKLNSASIDSTSLLNSSKDDFATTQDAGWWTFKYSLSNESGIKNVVLDIYYHKEGSGTVSLIGDVIHPDIDGVTVNFHLENDAKLSMLNINFGHTQIDQTTGTDRYNCNLNVNFFLKGATASVDANYFSINSSSKKGLYATNVNVIGTDYQLFKAEDLNLYSASDKIWFNTEKVNFYIYDPYATLASPAVVAEIFNGDFKETNLIVNVKEGGLAFASGQEHSLDINGATEYIGKIKENIYGQYIDGHLYAAISNPAALAKNLKFGEQTPAVPEGKDYTTVYVNSEEDYTLTFDNEELPFWMNQAGFTVETAYTVKQLDIATPLKTETDEDGFRLSYTKPFPTNGTAFMEDLKLKFNGTLVTDATLRNTIYIYGVRTLPIEQFTCELNDKGLPHLQFTTNWNERTFYKIYRSTTGDEDSYTLLAETMDTGEYTDTTAKREQTYWYKVCTAAGNKLGTMSNAIQISVPPIAKITTQPKATTYAKAGETVTLTVAGKGSVLTYQWYVKKAGATSYTKAGTTATFTAKMAKEYHGSSVYCVITDRYGNQDQSNTAKLYCKDSVSAALSTTSYTYDGKVKTPDVVVKDIAGNTLKKDTDYTVSYADGRKNAGTYKVTVTMKGNYTGTKTLSFKIKPIDVSKCKISLSKTSYTYNGKVQKPTVTVKNASGTKLTTSSYTVTYANGLKNVGTYKVTIKMKGNYTGTKTLSFKIKPIDVSKCKISLSKTSYTYNGKAQKPSVTVKNASGTKLTTSSYTVTYANGLKNVGIYKVTIKMKGNYTGTKTLTYKINPVKTTVSKLTAGEKKLTVNITKKSTQVTGYEIQYSTSKKFTSAKTKKVTSYKTTSVTLKSLKAKKTYYVRVRTYKTVNGTKYYSGWSTYKYKKTK